MAKPNRELRNGDLIRYECSENPPQPRWLLSDDRGGKGNFKHARVVDAQGSQAIIELSDKTRIPIPQPSHDGWVHYWDEPGFYQLIEEDSEEPSKKVLVQSMRRQRVRSCDCGAERSGAKQHYSWCDILQR